MQDTILVSSVPFRVEFVIIYNYQYKSLTVKQKQMKYQMLMGNILHDIFKTIFQNDARFKYLERSEPAISSLDETKQLRLVFDTLHLESWRHQRSLHFHQSNGSQYMSMEELTYVTYKMKKGLEEFLHYEIDEPILYVHLQENIN